jgi:hypothetical protein
LLGRPIFNKPLEMRFGRIGLGLLIVGAVLFIISLFMRTAEPAWFLLVPSAMFAMTGIQLGTNWMLVKTLAELSQREMKASKDIGAAESDDNAVVIRSSGAEKALA